MVRHAVLWLSLLWTLLLPIGGRETHMAEITLYDQIFAAGTSVWDAGGGSNVDYTRGSGGDAADPLYPEAWGASGVHLNGSGHLDSGVFGYSYTNAAFRAGDVLGAAFPGGPFSIPEGFFEVTAKPNATSLAAVGTLGEIFGFPTGVLLYYDHTNHKLWIDAFSFDFGEEFFAFASWTAVANTTYVIRMEWKVGTGGYMRVYIDGVLMLDSDVTMAGPFSASLNGATEDILKSYELGGATLFGEYIRIRFGIVSAAVPRDPLVDNSVPCCHDGGTASGSGGQAGDVLGPSDTAPLPEWTPRCAGGGTYPAGTPVTHSEDWTLP